MPIDTLKPSDILGDPASIDRACRPGRAGRHLAALRGSDSEPARLRIATVFVSYGPYHIARARAVTRRPELDPYFIEISSVERKYPWRADNSSLASRFLTLSKETYEDSSHAALAKKLIAALRDLRPEVVAVAGYSERPMRAAVRWARAAGVPVIMMADSTQADYRRSRWWELLKRIWLRRYVDEVFVAGRASRDYFVKLGVRADRIRDCYDVVDNEFFSRRCDQLRAGGDHERVRAGLPDGYFLYVGRFAPEKNLAFLLRAYRRYRAMHAQPWELVMVGDGPQRAELQEFARVQGLNTIIWPGFKQSDLLPVYYAFARAFVLPSVLEPWGLVVNEAMASGLPVIVSDRCGCARDLVRHGENGFTFDPSSEQELAGLMLEMATLPAPKRSAMGGASREIISRWTPETWAGQLTSAAQCAMNAL